VAARLVRLLPVLVFGSVPGSVALKKVGVGVAEFRRGPCRQGVG
jgi:hypothetical protein